MQVLRLHDISRSPGSQSHQVSTSADCHSSSVALQSQSVFSRHQPAPVQWCSWLQSTYEWLIGSHQPRWTPAVYVSGYNLLPFAAYGFLVMRPDSASRCAAVFRSKCSSRTVASMCSGSSSCTSAQAVSGHAQQDKCLSPAHNTHERRSLPSSPCRVSEIALRSIQHIKLSYDVR